MTVFPLTYLSQNLYTGSEELLGGWVEVALLTHLHCQVEEKCAGHVVQLCLSLWVAGALGQLDQQSAETTTPLAILHHHLPV